MVTMLSVKTIADNIIQKSISLLFILISEKEKTDEEIAKKEKQGKDIVNIDKSVWVKIIALSIDYDLLQFVNVEERPQKICEWLNLKGILCRLDEKNKTILSNESGYNKSFKSNMYLRDPPTGGLSFQG